MQFVVYIYKWLYSNCSAQFNQLVKKHLKYTNFTMTICYFIILNDVFSCGTFN